MQPLVSITANDIDQAGLVVDVELPRQWITAVLDAEGMEGVADGHLNARLSRSGRADIVVRGTVEASVAMPCARCLRPATTAVHGELALLLKPRAPAVEPSRSPSDKKSQRGEKGKPPRVAEYEFTSEEADVDEYDGETVVLDPFIREAILLELPNFPLCSESCPGISHAPPAARREGTLGTPMRANPFEALKHLRANLGQHVSEDGAEVNGADAAPDAPARGMSFSAPELGRAATKKKSETKIASTHAAPRRRASSKSKQKPSQGAGKRMKRT